MENLSSANLDRAALIDAFHQAAREFSTATVMFHSVIADRIGLNRTDHNCLDILLRLGPLTAGRLGELTGLTTGAITGVIDRLEQANFVQRAQDPTDRRRVIVQPLVGEAERQISPLFTSIEQAMTDLCSQYSDQELAVILDFTRRSVKTLQEETARLRTGETVNSEQ